MDKKNGPITENMTIPANMEVMQLVMLTILQQRVNTPWLFAIRMWGEWNNKAYLQSISTAVVVDGVVGREGNETSESETQREEYLSPS